MVLDGTLGTVMGDEASSVEMVFGGISGLCECCFAPESQSMGCRAGLGLGSRQSYVLTLVNCGIRYERCCDLCPRLYGPTFGNDSKSEFQAAVSCPPTAKQQIDDVGAA